MAKQLKIMSTSGGNPAADNRNSITVGPHGNYLMQDSQLSGILAHQSRERIAGCAVHVNGPAACSTLTITREIMRAPGPGEMNDKCLAVRS